MTSEREDFGGMTVNERLAAANLLGAWDQAITAGDRERAIAVLKRVALNDEQAMFTVDTVLANPARYGFTQAE
ncbi:hypothetical protein [Microbacterium sp. Marseille-Q6965]|uniref:hypothetical protein n=1 Tax=Microbacterium sp. Marseille-Q6965 TaxID=2965072 RepID=UPI0021B8081E|nr:hypothetical protein [Microbacterium sp. Marseille-Q6965]